VELKPKNITGRCEVGTTVSSVRHDANGKLVITDYHLQRSRGFTKYDYGFVGFVVWNTPL